MSRARRWLPSRFSARVSASALTLACLVGGCQPPQAVDRAPEGLVGGIMRDQTAPPSKGAGGTGGMTPPSAPPKSPTQAPSIDEPVPDAGVPIPIAPDADVTGDPPDAGVIDAADPVAEPDDAAPVSEPDAAAQPPQPSPPDVAPPAPEPNGVDCSGVMPWSPDGPPYLGGEKRTHGTPRHLFECRPWPNAPWCGLASYEPGQGEPWMDAWFDRGACR